MIPERTSRGFAEWTLREISQGTTRKIPEGTSEVIPAAPREIVAVVFEGTHEGILAGSFWSTQKKSQISWIWADMAGKRK